MRGRNGKVKIDVQADAVCVLSNIKVAACILAFSCRYDVVKGCDNLAVFFTYVRLFLSS